MRARYESLSSPRPSLHGLVTAISVVGAAMGLAGGCGGSGTDLTTDTVTMCAASVCTGPRPANPSVVCPDDSIAGPACIQHADGTCGWAVLTCPIERGPSGGAGGAAGGSPGVVGGRSGQAGKGGQSQGGSGGIATGGVIGTGGGVSPTGGTIGTGGAVATGGTIGTGGVSPTGGTFATGGTFGTGGFIGTGGFFGTGGGFGGTGGSGTGGLGFNGSFSWTGNGQSQSTSGYYEENLALSGTSFIITIAADAIFSDTPCALTGQFPTVPPPPGTYPVADVMAPQADGTFVGRCSSYGQALAYADASVSGQIVLSQSKAGLVEGSFTMHARASFDGTGGAPVSGVTYTGAFSVGCRDGRPITDPACASRSIAR